MVAPVGASAAEEFLVFEMTGRVGECDADGLDLDRLDLVLLDLLEAASDLRRVVIGRGFGASLESAPSPRPAPAPAPVPDPRPGRPAVAPRRTGLGLPMLASGDDRLRADESEESLDAESRRPLFRDIGVRGCLSVDIFRGVWRVAWPEAG